MWSNTIIYNYLLVVIIMSLSSCRHDSLGTQNSEKEDILYQASITLKDKFEQVSNNFIQGDAITIELSISSDSILDTVLTFGSYKFYDVYIENESGGEVWRMSDNIMYKQETAELKLKANGRIVFLDGWDQVLSDGKTIDIGTYTLFAYWIGYGDVVQTVIKIE